MPKHGGSLGRIYGDAIRKRDDAMPPVPDPFTTHTPHAEHSAEGSSLALVLPDMPLDKKI